MKTTITKPLVQFILVTTLLTILFRISLSELLNNQLWNLVFIPSFRYNLAATNFGVGVYSIANASQITQVWDVTNTTAIAAKANNEAASTFSFKAELGDVREYVAVTASDYYTPISVSDSSVPNQNLKGTIFQGEDGNFDY